MKCESDLKIYSVGIMHPNVIVKITSIKPLERNLGVNLHNLGFDKGFLDVTPNL